MSTCSLRFFFKIRICHTKIAAIQTVPMARARFNQASQAGAASGMVIQNPEYDENCREHGKSKQSPWVGMLKAYENQTHIEQSH